MKTTIVPAQITTVEDKIAGGLTFQQLALLMSPVGIGAITFILVPQPMDLSLPKISFDVVVAAVFGLMSVRVQGRLVVQWARTILAYGTRNRYTVYDKRERAVTNPHNPKSPVYLEDGSATSRNVGARPGQLSANIAHRMRVETLISGSHTELVYRASKKGLQVVVSESK